MVFLWNGGQDLIFLQAKLSGLTFNDSKSLPHRIFPPFSSDDIFHQDQNTHQQKELELLKCQRGVNRSST